YACAAQKRNGQTCPAPSISAGPIEELVVEQIEQLGPDIACEDFTSLWEALPASEQARLVHLVVERVDYDGLQGKITITFHSDASNVLAQARAKHQPASARYLTSCCSLRPARGCGNGSCRSGVKGVNSWAGNSTTQKASPRDHPARQKAPAMTLPVL